MNEKRLGGGKKIKDKVEVRERLKNLISKFKKSTEFKALAKSLETDKSKRTSLMKAVQECDLEKVKSILETSITDDQSHMFGLGDHSHKSLFDKRFVGEFKCSIDAVHEIPLNPIIFAYPNLAFPTQSNAISGYQLIKKPSDSEIREQDLLQRNEALANKIYDLLEGDKRLDKIDIAHAFKGIWERKHEILPGEQNLRDIISEEVDKVLSKNTN